MDIGGIEWESDITTNVTSTVDDCRRHGGQDNEMEKEPHTDDDNNGGGAKDGTELFVCERERNKQTVTMCERRTIQAIVWYGTIPWWYQSNHPP